MLGYLVCTAIGIAFIAFVAFVMWATLSGLDDELDAVEEEFRESSDPVPVKEDTEEDIADRFYIFQVANDIHPLQRKNREN